MLPSNLRFIRTKEILAERAERGEIILNLAIFEIGDKPCEF